MKLLGAISTIIWAGCFIASVMMGQQELMYMVVCYLSILANRGD
jgi:hypothetical protein